MKKAPSRISRLLFLLLLAALLAGPFGGGLVSVARAQVQLNLGNVDIQVFVKLISRLTGKTFIADDRVKGRVTVFSPREVTAEEAYRIFLGVLEVMGYSTLQTSRGVIKIIPSEEASRSNPPTFFARRPKNRPENFQTRVIPLKHLKVEDVEPMVGAMISSVGQLIVFRRNNSMVVSDYLTNIDRILEVLAVFDRQGLGDRVEVIPLRHSPVEAIAKVLREIRPDVLSAAAPAAGVRPPRGRRRRRVPRPRRPLRPLAGGRGIIGDKSPVTIVADERINAIILMGPRARIEEMKRLIATLDVPSTSLQKNLYVHPLKNASAEELLPVLRELIAGASQGAAERRQGGERRRDRRRRRAGEGTETERLETGFLGEVNVVADKGTNTLVITATQRDYEALKPVIEKLDIKRRQVHIEAIIAEITSSASSVFIWPPGSWGSTSSRRETWRGASSSEGPARARISPRWFRRAARPPGA
ncbi:MAG: secretin N-terminal domain-containing protein [Nitrospinota bacterium]